METKTAFGIALKNIVTGKIKPRGEILKDCSHEINDEVRVLCITFFILGYIEGFLICLGCVAIWNIFMTF
jgi:hypothetical protein